MSAPDCAPSLSGSKRTASPTAAETPSQRMRLECSAAAADPPPAVRPPLSAAQSCAADTLTLVFGFIELKELVSVARSCKAWLAAAAKDQPRGLSRSFDRFDQLAALCAISSPFKKHISRIYCSSPLSLSLAQLAQLRQLPELTVLRVQLNAADLKRLMDETGGWLLVQLKAAFPPKLRDLTLCVTDAHSTAVCQLLLDALPAMKELEQLTLTAMVHGEPGQSELLSLEPLLQLPHLTHLEWSVGELTVPQLQIIKQLSTLQSIDTGFCSWSSAQLSSFCRPPHRLQRLQELQLCYTSINATAMADLLCLPALTVLEPTIFTAGAYAFLPHFPRLQRLGVRIDCRIGGDADQREAQQTALLLALPACTALTHLTLAGSECSEQFGSQLMQAVPRLRSLSFDVCSVPSLRFLRHAPNLKDLSLNNCGDVRLGHVIGIGAFAPQLESLSVLFCGALHLDEAEQQLLTPPGAMGMPNLLEFDYIPAESEES